MPQLNEKEIVEVSIRFQAPLPAAVYRLLLLASGQPFLPDRSRQPSRARGEERRSSRSIPNAARRPAPPSAGGSLKGPAAERACGGETTPRLLLKLKTREAYYRGHFLELPPLAFELLVLLASRPGQLVTKDEIYDRLWPESRDPAGEDRPYERQIADHKRKLMAGLRALTEVTPGLSPHEVEGLVLTKPRRGYLLKLSAEEVAILPHTPVAV